MKRIVWVSLCTIIIVFFLLIVLQKRRVTSVQSALFLPQDVLAVVEQKDLSQKLDEFKESRLGKAIREIDYLQLATDIGLQEEELEIIQDIQEEGTEFLESPIFTELFGEDVTFAFLQPQSNFLVDPEKNIKSSMLLIVRPKHNAKTLEKIISLFGHDIKQSVIQYGNHVIRRYEIDKDTSFAAARVEGLFLIACNERVIRLSLDRYDEKRDSLLQNEDYKGLKKNYDKPDLFVYFSLDNLKKLFEELITQEKVTGQEEFIQELATWNGLRAGAYGAWQESDLIIDKSVLLVDREKLHPYVKEMISTPPEKSNEISMVAGNALAYYWTNTFNLQTLFNMYVSELSDEKTEIDLLNQNVEQVTGVKLEQVITGIGHKAGMIIQDMNSEEFIPLPDFSIFLRLEDKKLIKDVLEKLLVHWDIPYESQNYRGVELYFWGLVPQTGMQPVIAFYDEYLYFASSVAMIKQIIDTAKDGDGLATNEMFQKIEHGLLEDNNSIAYIQVGAIVEIMKELVSWGGTMIAIQDRQVAHTSKILIDKLIHPLLDGLKMYSVIGVRSYIEEDKIIYRTETIVEQ